MGMNKKARDDFMDFIEIPWDDIMYSCEEIYCVIDTLEDNYRRLINIILYELRQCGVLDIVR